MQISKIKGFRISLSPFIIPLLSGVQNAKHLATHQKEVVVVVGEMLQPSLMIQIFPSSSHAYIDIYTDTEKEKNPGYSLCKKSSLKCHRNPCCRRSLPSEALCPRVSGCSAVSDNITLFQAGMSQTLMWTCSGTSGKED